jgi:serine/threonine protein kinase
MSAEDILRGAERIVNGIEKDETALKTDDRLDAFAPVKRSLAYEFLAELSPGIWKVVRKSDRFEFLARDLTKKLQTPDGEPTVFSKLLHPLGENFMETLMRILNHENLVNFVDWIQVQSSPTLKVSSLDSRQYLLLDFCNAGTLSHLFVRPKDTKKTLLHYDQDRRMPDHAVQRDGPTESRAFLPEAFCWHVLCSLLKALAWLHHGIREELDPAINTYKIVRADVDWQTILHRDIKPSCVYFCHPQTKLETYGLCKLGGFQYASVSGAFNGVLWDKVPGVPVDIVVPHPDQKSTPALDSLRRTAADPGIPLVVCIHAFI